MIEDIQVDVPQGVQVTIPAEKAHKSKDLWRAINQKQLFLFRSGPHTPMLAPVSTAVERELREKNQRLEAENQELRVQLHQQQTEAQKSMQDTQKLMASQQERMDSLLKMLTSGAVFSQGPAPRVVGVVDDTVIDGSAPAYIPESITPKTAESRIETKTEQSGSTGVSGAAGRLREMRQRPKQ